MGKFVIILYYTVILMLGKIKTHELKQCGYVPILNIGDNDNFEIVIESSEIVYFYDVPPTPLSTSKRYFFCKENSKCNFDLNSFVQKERRIELEKDKLHEISIYLIDENGSRIELKDKQYVETYYHSCVLGELIRDLQDKIKAKKQEDYEGESIKEKLRSELTAEYLPKRIHNDLFTLSDEIFDESFLKIIRNPPKTKEDLLKFIKKETETWIYSFPMLKRSFCEKLVQEIENIQNSGLNLKSPNTMNRYGVILDDFGFYSFLDNLMKNYLSVLSSLLYPEWGGGSLDSHHGFAVEYKLGFDEKLDYHMDSCEVTLNVCLGKKFVGGSLFFNGVRNELSEKQENFKFEHVPGMAIMHVGQHWHGARKITEGERYNLILWMMSSKYRASPAERYVEKCFKENNIHCCTGEL